MHNNSVSTPSPIDGRRRACITSVLGHLMEQVASCGVMDEAYEWLCQTRINYSANADIWDLRKNWSLVQPQLQRQLLIGEFQFSVQTQYRFSDEIKVVWAAVDSRGGATGSRDRR